MTDPSPHPADVAPSAPAPPEPRAMEQPLHDKENERRRAEESTRSAIPPNPNADTAYGPVRGEDPAHPDASQPVPPDAPPG